MPTTPTPPSGQTGTTATTPTSTGPVAPDLASLQKAVAAEVEADQSAVKLITGMAAQITKLSQQPGGASPTDLSALAKQLNDSATALATAVTANTPAEHSK